MVPRSFLLFISVPSSITNPNGWSLISKLMLARLIASRKGHKILNEVGSVDLALKSLHDHIKNNDVRVGVEMASQRLKTLDSSIERLESGLDDAMECKPLIASLTFKINFKLTHGYTKWVAHGEVKSSAAPLSRAHVALDVINDMQGLLHDRFYMSSDEVREGATDVAMEGHNAEADKFYKLLQDSQEMLYKDCKNFSRLSFLVRLLHIKSLGKMNNKAFTYLLELQNEAFPDGRVLELYLAGDERISEELRILARDPNKVVTKYKGFIINGFRFHIKELERNRKTQNSGLVVNVMTPSFSNARDDNPIIGDLTYYGALEEIIELQYSGSKRVVLFRSNWVSKGSRKKEDENGFTLLNFKRLTSHKELFVLASQVQQVFYIEDVGGWHVVIKTTARDAFDMNAIASEDDVETYLQSEPCNAQEHDRDDDVSWVREGVQGTIIDMNGTCSTT
ncbi:hypothetical protein RJ639_041974 [Escallonia herrerae]|uniref:DUF4216 domain-containing protein n=1 Tax=Escallonia herrerae TaxID=1293975 RepID=A0AA88WH83_9ASTE|nr:hypothetical protein RJ639_041974 [Escallonia herrerae]